MSATPGDRELSVREAARSVQRAEETIRRWIWVGKLPARKLPDGYRVHERDLIAVAGGRPSPAAATERSLRRWMADVSAWRAGNGVAAREGAGHLVIEDRADRSGRGRR